jgi:hypothetical protein
VKILNVRTLAICGNDPCTTGGLSLSLFLSTLITEVYPGLHQRGGGI